jgi:hypothetical protein
LNQNALLLVNTEVLNASMHAINCSYGLRIEDSNVKSIHSSSFIGCGSTNNHHGGAITVKNSNIMITNSTFNSNRAIRGAGIFFDCSIDNQ